MKKLFLLPFALCVFILSSCKKDPVTYKVGQQALGGVVIKTDASGEHGLVAANKDQIAVNSGKNYEKSLEIVNSYNEGGSGWRMPNKDELIQIYNMKSSLGSFESWYYWSSTKVGESIQNYTVNFNNGNCTGNCSVGNYNFCSRAVKDF